MTAGVLFGLADEWPGLAVPCEEYEMPETGAFPRGIDEPVRAGGLERSPNSPRRRNLAGCESGLPVGGRLRGINAEICHGSGVPKVGNGIRLDVEGEYGPFGVAGARMLDHGRLDTLGRGTEVERGLSAAGVPTIAAGARKRGVDVLGSHSAEKRSVDSYKPGVLSPGYCGMRLGAHATSVRRIENFWPIWPT